MIVEHDEIIFLTNTKGRFFGSWMILHPEWADYDEENYNDLFYHIPKWRGGR